MNEHVSFAKQDHRPWQAVEYEILSRMAANGKTDVEIGAMLDRHRQAVMEARKKMGIASAQPLVFWTEPEMAQLEKLVRKGFSDDEIGARLGRSRDSVRTKRLALGLNPQAPAPAPSGRAEPTRRLTTAEELLKARPCPINAEYVERVRANAAYLIAGKQAGHEVFAKGRGPE